MNKKSLSVCIIISLLLCMAQVSGKPLLIAGVLLLFLIFLTRETLLGRALPTLLFFLPWAVLMKVYQSSFSWYTVGLILVCGIRLCRSGFHLSRNITICGLLLVVSTLIAKVLRGHDLQANYIVFFLMVFLLPTVMKEERPKEGQFYELTLFLAFGVLLAALCAGYFQNHENIKNYIPIESYAGITRRSGFGHDPNFYAAQISVAIAGLLMLSLERPRKQAVFSLCLTPILIYFGLLSGSKSFVLVTILTVCLWVVLLFLRHRRAWPKICLGIGVALAVAILLSRTLLQDLTEMLLFRFSFSADLSQLTTGRTDIWLGYLRSLLSDPLTLFLGHGFSDVLLDGVATHNTLLQAVYQFGLFGSAILLFWGWELGDGNVLQYPYGPRRLGLILLLCVGIFLPWMALDLLFFDEFFLFHWYFLLGAECLKTPTAS